MIPDPFAGDTFVLPETDCSDERKLFFIRMNEIISFIYIAKVSFDICKKKYENDIIPKLPFGENTPLKLEWGGDKSIMLPVKQLTEMTTNGINLLKRQAVAMFYGNFETYLFKLFEKSFPLVGVKDDILDKSLNILMKGKWDGKFCRMNEVFNIGYRANDLISWFKGFEMNFEGKNHENPLNFLDEVAFVRHKIVHASSILEDNGLIVVDMNFLHGFYGFFFHLTDYTDNLFAKRFGYARSKL